MKLYIIQNDDYFGFDPGYDQLMFTTGPYRYEGSTYRTLIIDCTSVGDAFDAYTYFKFVRKKKKL